MANLRGRLDQLEASLQIQRQQLLRTQTDLATARARLGSLRAELVRGQRLLAAQLVAQYESPQPNIVGVVLNSNGFSDLLERVSQMSTIARGNAQTIVAVRIERVEVAQQAAALSATQAREERVTSAVLIERDQVAALKLAILRRETVTAADRARKQAELHSVEHQLAVLQARALAAQRASFSLGASGATYSGGAPASGGYGFFPAPGTNYAVGQEPEIAARLNTLGIALHLHLIGLSGYRSPQHSVEVGGFADDPHTRGEASDTPGVEGVPEATLLHFGLTRPFAGPAEADHIQLA